MSSGLPALLSCAIAALGGGLAGALRPDTQIQDLLMEEESSAHEGGRGEMPGLGNLTQRIRQLGINETEAPCLLSMNWQFFAISMLGVFLFALLNSCWKTVFPKEGQSRASDLSEWARSCALVTVLFLHTVVCFAGTYCGNDDSCSHIGGEVTRLLPALVKLWNIVHPHWTHLILLVSITWMLWGYVHEACWTKRAPVHEGEILTAHDVYTNAMEGMFSVTVRFVLQSCLLLILVFVAEEGWRNPPKDVPLFRKVWNFILALTLQLYMVGQAKGSCEFRDMRRLRTVRAVQLVGIGPDSSTPCGSLRLRRSLFRMPTLSKHAGPDCGAGEEVEILEESQLTKGDYYVRVAMSIVANSVFHKFILLSYPIFIFGYIGNADMLSIVKDILAITIVQEIDNLTSPVRFRVTEVESSVREV